MQKSDHDCAEGELSTMKLLKSYTKKEDIEKKTEVESWREAQVLKEECS